MKILILGPICSQWTLNFVETCLLKNNYEVWMPKRTIGSEDRKYLAIYKEKGVNFIDCTGAVNVIYNGMEKSNYLKILYGHLLQIRAILRAADFDLINVHYVNTYDIVYGPILKYMKRAKLIFSYWGSDLFCVGERRLRLREIFVRQTDYVTFDNKDLEIKFKKTYKCAYKVPSETVLFGLPILNIINEKYKNKSSTDLKEKWNIPIDLTMVAVGYNASLSQQHIEVLNEIRDLDDETKKKIFILLQMTYSGTKEYRKQVISAAKKTGCKYMVIQDFLSDDEVAELRIMTDIYINAQTTDAFSGSVCENLFAGTILINAKWLCYQEFKENDFKYLEFNNVNEIGQLIRIAMEQEIDVSKNRNLVWLLRSWEYCAKKWKKTFRRVIQQRNRKRG